jgi:hypothetical protein
MRDRFAERALTRGLMIHVERVIISREPGESHHVRGGDRPARAFPLVADRQVVKKEGGQHVPSHGNDSETENTLVTFPWGLERIEKRSWERIVQGNIGVVKIAPEPSARQSMADP